jgi:hypothetical protein
MTMRGGKQDREGKKLVPCVKCPGNVHLKVPEESGVVSDQPTPEELPKVLPGILPDVGQMSEQHILEGWDSSVAQGGGASSMTEADSYITVVEYVYYQQRGELDPVAVEVLYNRRTQTSEQAYVRQLSVGDQWTPIDQGWLKETGVGLLVLQNEGIKFSTQPTQLQQEEADSKVVEVAILPKQDIGARRTMHSSPELGPQVFTQVRPVEALRLVPVDLESLRIRCRSGSVRCLLTLIPR